MLTSYYLREKINTLMDNRLSYYNIINLNNDNVTDESDTSGHCIYFDNIITKIPDYAFNQSDIYYIKLPQTVSHIGDYAFCASQLKYINLDNITYIGNAAFRNCRSLGCITLPKSLTYIAHDAFNCNYIYNYSDLSLQFENCTVFNHPVTYNGFTYCNIDNSNYNTLISCTCTDRMITIPDNIDEIRCNFSDNVSTIILPNNLQHIKTLQANNISTVIYNNVEYTNYHELYNILQQNNIITDTNSLSSGKLSTKPMTYYISTLEYIKVGHLLFGYNTPDWEGNIVAIT